MNGSNRQQHSHPHPSPPVSDLPENLLGGLEGKGPREVLAKLAPGRLGWPMVQATMICAATRVAVSGRRSWNPFDPSAWCYGRRSPRLRQTLLFLTGYSCAFVLIDFLPHPTAVAEEVEPFGLPAGGGSDQAGPAPRMLRIQMQVRSKSVVNPYSSILFSVPTMDKVDLRVGDDTRHEYRAGYGSGTGTGTGGIGSGFGAGKGNLKVRLPRLKHTGRGWDKNLGIGGDDNMLAMYSALTQQKVADKTEVIDIEAAIKLAYREALTREPTAEEITDARAILTGAKNALDGMADLRWALLNSNEFRYLP